MIREFRRWCPNQQAETAVACIKAWQDHNLAASRGPRHNTGPRQCLSFSWCWPPLLLVQLLRLLSPGLNLTLNSTSMAASASFALLFVAPLITLIAGQEFSFFPNGTLGPDANFVSDGCSSAMTVSSKLSRIVSSDFLTRLARLPFNVKHIWRLSSPPISTGLSTTKRYKTSSATQAAGLHLQSTTPASLRRARTIRSHLTAFRQHILGTLPMRRTI